MSERIVTIGAAGEPRQALAAVIAGDEGGLRRLAELLASYMPAPTVPSDDRWMDSREAAAYAGTTREALHKAMAARGPLRAGVPWRQSVVQAGRHRRLRRGELRAAA